MKDANMRKLSIGYFALFEADFGLLALDFEFDPAIPLTDEGLEPIFGGVVRERGKWAVANGELDELRYSVEFLLSTSEAEIVALGWDGVDSHIGMIDRWSIGLSAMPEEGIKKILGFTRRRLCPNLGPMSREEQEEAKRTVFLDIPLEEYRQRKKGGTLDAWSGKTYHLGSRGNGGASP